MKTIPTMPGKLNDSVMVSNPAQVVNINLQKAQVKTVESMKAFMVRRERQERLLNESAEKIEDLLKQQLKRKK